jgi:hypothetical protein
MGRSAPRRSVAHDGLEIRESVTEPGPEAPLDIPFSGSTPWPDPVLATKELEMQTISPTPARPQTRTCAWCCERFGTTVDLLDHVDDTHLDPRTPSPAERSKSPADRGGVRSKRRPR